MLIDNKHYFNKTKANSAASGLAANTNVAGRSPQIRRTGPHGRRHLSLALQGGGSFGAFTWGFIDRLLEEPDLSIDMVSGASAGALNALILADGLAAGGADEARRKLDHFWHRVAHDTPHLPVGPGHPTGALFDLSTRLASPYQLNPLNLNPLRTLLREEVDFERVREASPVRLLVAATRVRDGRLRLFRENEISVDVALASACLPLLHHAVEIDGEAYWDGGYTANPPIRQLVIDTKATDIVLLQIMPEEKDEVPHFSPDIARRLQAIAFANSLHKELEAFEDLRALCRGLHGPRSALRRKVEAIRLHTVKAVDSVEGLAHESALDTHWPLISRLKEGGREAAEHWLAGHPAVNAPRSWLSRRYG